MALSKETKVNRLSILTNGAIQVRESVQILEDGAVIQTSTNTRLIQAGADVSGESKLVQAIAGAIAPFIPEPAVETVTVEKEMAVNIFE